MKTYTLTLSAGEFWQVQMALEARTEQLQASIATQKAGGFDASTTAEFLLDAGRALHRVKRAEPDSAALSMMLTAPKGPRR